MSNADSASRVKSRGCQLCYPAPLPPFNPSPNHPRYAMSTKVFAAIVLLIQSTLAFDVSGIPSCGVCAVSTPFLFEQSLTIVENLHYGCRQFSNALRPNRP